ncbi:MAG: thiamine phosphate synthase [Pseudomonadota bacterium]
MVSGKGSLIERFNVNNRMQDLIKRFNAIDLYPVISAEQSFHKDPVYILDEILKTDVKIVQLREKSLSKKDLYELAMIFREKTFNKKVLFIVNNDIDIALAVNADGVHLGNDDLPLKVARKLAPNLIIGKSSHNMKEAIEAKEFGADYINVGPIFETPTKQGMKAVGIEAFTKISNQIDIPITVMGGINKENISTCLEAGANKVAMIRGIIENSIIEDVNNLYKVYSRF